MTATEKPKTTKTKPDTRREAMVEGRSQAAAVRSYLDALKLANTPKRRGRKRTPETINARLKQIEAELHDESIDVIQELKLTQERTNLIAEIETLVLTPPNPAEYVSGFIKVAKKYSDRQGISVETWRIMGVPRDVLKKAGL